MEKLFLCVFVMVFVVLEISVSLKRIEKVFLELLISNSMNIVHFFWHLYEVTVWHFR